MSQYEDIFEVEEKPKRKRSEDPTTWADAWKALGLFIAITTVFSLIIEIIHHRFFMEVNSKYWAIDNSSKGVDELYDALGSYSDFLGNANAYVFYFILMILIAGGLLLIYGIIHVFVTKFQGGEGTLRGLIVRANGWTTGTYIVSGILVNIQSTYTSFRIIERYEGVNISESFQTFTEYNDFVASHSSIMVLIFFAFWILWTIGIAFISANNYQVKKYKGCLALFATNCILFLFMCGVAFAFSNAILNMISTS